MFLSKDNSRPFCLYSMVTIEYNDIKVSVPENWDDITLGEYEAFCMKKPQTARERVEQVAYICKVEVSILLNWPAEVFNTIVGFIAFLFEDNKTPPSPEIQIDGVKYVVNIQEKLTLGEWVDIEEVQKNGKDVISNTLAIVCRPVGEEYDEKNNDARAVMFANMPVGKVLGVMAFFLCCNEVLKKRANVSLRLSELSAQLPRSIRPLLKHGGGIRLLRIWRTLKYYALIVLLRYQLCRFLSSCDTARIKGGRKKLNVN